jgi:zinc transport system permease protein
MGTMAGGISHSALGGMGIATYFALSPQFGAIVAALTFATVLLILGNSRQRQDHLDTWINALWSVSMALGIIFLSQTPGYKVNLSSYLFGNILMISPHEIYVMAAYAVICAAVLFLFRRPIKAVCFDPEFAALRGLHVRFFEGLVIYLVAIAAVLLVQVVGLILVIALLTLPAATGQLLAHRMAGISLLAGVFAAIATCLGLLLSFTYNFPAGASIIAVLAAQYTVVAAFSRYALLKV